MQNSFLWAVQCWLQMALRGLACVMQVLGSATMRAVGVLCDNDHALYPQCSERPSFPQPGCNCSGQPMSFQALAAVGACVSMTHSGSAHKVPQRHFSGCLPSACMPPEGRWPPAVIHRRLGTAPPLMPPIIAPADIGQGVRLPLRMQGCGPDLCSRRQGAHQGGRAGADAGPRAVVLDPQGVREPASPHRSVRCLPFHWVLLVRIRLAEKV